MRTTRSRDRWIYSPAMTALRADILRALRDIDGLTDASLERHPIFVRRRFGYSTLRSRRGELVELGLVERRGIVADANRDGRITRMVVWGLTTRGRFLDPARLNEFERREMLRRQQVSAKFGVRALHCA